MPEPSTLLVFGAAALAFLVVPGPAVLYIVTRGLDQGRGAALTSVLGIESGALVHVAAATFGLSALLASSATAYTVVRYLGAAYLVYLGVRRLLQRGGTDEVRLRQGNARRIFWQGFVVNALNPKTALFFLAFLPQFVRPGSGPAVAQIFALGVAWILLALVSDGAYALLASAARGWLGVLRQARRGMDVFAGCAYIGLGAAAALTGHRARA